MDTLGLDSRDPEKERRYVNIVPTLANSLTQVPMLYLTLFSAERDATLKYVGDTSRFGLARTGVIGSLDPSYKYVEHMLFNPDNDKDRILERQRAISILLPLDFHSSKECFDQVVSSYTQLKDLEKQYFNPELDISDKETALSNGVSSLVSLHEEAESGINHLSKIQYDGIREILRGMIQMFAQIFPEDPRDICDKFPEKCFSYIGKLAGFIEEVTKLRGIFRVLDFIKHFEMQPATFAEENIGYSDARSVFEEKEKNVLASSFPDLSLIFLRAPNGSGKTFAEERDMAIQVLGQSLGYVPAKNPRLRIYDIIWMQSRLQSVQYTDSDLSALGVEGKSLDHLYGVVMNSPGKTALIYLDETGATTDEKNEHRMMQKFVDALQFLAPTSRIRFSTHNQPLIDEMRARNNDGIGFFTYNHEHVLEAGERHSDTINSMKRLFAKWQTEIDKFYSERYHSLPRDIETFLKKISGVEISSWGKERTRKKIETAWADFSGFVSGLVLELEQLENGNVSTPSRRQEASLQIAGAPQIQFTPEQKEVLASRSKGVRDGLFPSTNQRFDYQIATVSHPRWRNSRKTMIGRRNRGFHFYEDTNYGDSDRDREDPFASARKRDEGEYRDRPIGYTNAESWYGMSNGVERTAQVKTRPKKPDQVIKMIHEIYNEHAGLNIPLTQEKRDMLAELYENPEQREALIRHGTFLMDMIGTFIMLRQELHIDFIRTSEKGEKPFLGRFLQSLRVVKDTDSYEKETECMRFLKNQGRDYIYNHDFPHQLIRWYELIRSLYMLAGGESGVIASLDATAKRYHELRIMKDQKIISREDESVIEIIGQIKSNLLVLVEQTIPDLLERGGDMTLEQFFSGDYRDSLIELPGVERDREYIWISSLKFFAKHKDDSTQHLRAFHAALGSFHCPLLRGIANYYRDILGFSLGNVENIPSLFAYYSRYVEELGPHGFYPFSTLRNDGNLSRDKYGDYRDKLLYEDDPTVPNMTGDIEFWHHGMRAVAYDVGEFLAVAGASEFIREEGMTQVEFTDRKVLEITGMGNQDVDKDKKFVANSVSLTREYPIEIIEGFNSSGKTQYIRNVLKCLNQGLNIGYVNAESMKIGNLSQYAYMDRIVGSGRGSDLSSGQKDILSWIELLKMAEEKDFLIVEADEIFSTMDARYTALFAQVFIGNLRSMGKYAIIVTHNHAFAETFSKLPGVQRNHFHSELQSDGSVVHSYKKRTGGIDDSHGVEVLKGIGIGKEWLN